MVLFYHLCPSTFYLGWTRVDLFFVLSGYLVTSMVLKFGPGPRPLIAFWVRRTLRILPAYYGLLVVLSIAEMSRNDGEGWRLGCITSHMTFTQNFPHYWSGETTRLGRGSAQTWSLAIEVQFYLLWPLIVALTGRRLLVPTALWLIVNSVAARSLGLYPAVALARCDGLALGSILAYVLKNFGQERPRPPLWHNTALFATGLTALLFTACFAARIEDPITGSSGCGPLSIFAVNLFYASLIGLIICHAGHRVLAPMRNRVLCYLGRISYGIYLYHLLIFDAVNLLLTPRMLAINVTAVLLTIMAAAASWELLERPCDMLSRKMVKSFGTSTDHQQRAGDKSQGADRIEEPLIVDQPATGQPERAEIRPSDAPG